MIDPIDTSQVPHAEPPSRPSPHTTPASTAARSRLIPAAQLSVHAIAPLFPPARLLSREREEALALKRQAQAELQQAKASAQQILANSMRSARAAQQRGLEAGRAAGLAQFTALTNALTSEIAGLRERAAHEVTRLALRFARAILEAEFTARPQRLEQLAAAVLERARFCRQAILRVHPDELPLIQSIRERLQSMVSAETRIELAGDSEVPLHGVRVETETGLLDGSLDTRFDRLADAILHPADGDDDEGADGLQPPQPPPAPEVPEGERATEIDADMDDDEPGFRVQDESVIEESQS